MCRPESRGLTPTTRHGFQLRLSPSELGKSAGALAFDQGAEDLSHEGGFALDARQPLRVLEQLAVYIHGAELKQPVMLRA